MDKVILPLGYDKITLDTKIRLTHPELTQLLFYRYTLSHELPQALLLTLSGTLGSTQPAGAMRTPQLKYVNVYVKN
jgi:hypothetical protein